MNPQENNSQLLIAKTTASTFKSRAYRNSNKIIRGTASILKILPISFDKLNFPTLSGINYILNITPSNVKLYLSSFASDELKVNLRFKLSPTSFGLSSHI
jgi:hypothetical protein